MHGLYVEERSLNGHGSLPWDLAHHMYARQFSGKIAVVAEQPKLLLPTLRKQWLKLMRQVQRERASTLNLLRINELTDAIAKMQNLRFSARDPKDDFDTDVAIATINQFLVFAPMCRTMYVTYPVTKEQLHLVTAWMARGGVVVKYRR